MIDGAPVDTHHSIMEILYDCIDEVNEQLAEEQQLRKCSQTRLLDDGASLDSLGFVNFVVLVEDKCESRFGVSLSLTDRSARSEQANPFETVGTLAEFIGRMLADSRSIRA